MWIKIILGIIIFLDLASKLPQIYKLYNYKNADSISVISYIAWNFSSLLYIIYCVSIKELPLLLETALNLTLNTIILFMSFYYNKKLHGNIGIKYEIKKFFK